MCSCTSRYNKNHPSFAEIISLNFTTPKKKFLEKPRIRKISKKMFQ